MVRLNGRAAKLDQNQPCTLDVAWSNQQNWKNLLNNKFTNPKGSFTLAEYSADDCDDRLLHSCRDRNFSIIVEKQWPIVLLKWMATSQNENKLPGTILENLCTCSIAIGLRFTTHSLLRNWVLIFSRTWRSRVRLPLTAKYYKPPYKFKIGQGMSSSSFE